MSYRPDLHQRRSIRLQGFDYAHSGAYFVTVCSHGRECLFGEFVDGVVELNEAGKVVVEVLQSLSAHFPHVDVSDYVVMPNHLHAIVNIAGGDVGAKQEVSASPVFDGKDKKGNADAKGKAGEALALPLRGTVAGSLGAIVQNFKSVSSRRINKLRNSPGALVWQRNYYERVIRNEA
jgi:hypothetical protein